MIFRSSFFYLLFSKIQVQTRSFDDDFDTDPEDDVVEASPTKKSGGANKNPDDDEDDSDFEDPDLISVPGGGKSLQTLSSKKGGGATAKQTSMPGLGKKKRKIFDFTKNFKS